MLDRECYRKTDEVFTDLFNAVNNDLESMGIKIEPSVIFEEIIAPHKTLYLRNLGELLASHLEKNQRYGSSRERMDKP